MTCFRLFLLASFGLLFLPSCFHKSDKTGEADDVSQFLLFQTRKGDYLTTHEEIFHAQSKSYNNGISQITGYTDYRFTVRDLYTGQQVTRMVTGDRENDATIIGFDGRNLWCYNAAKDAGIQARDPVTLQVIIGQQKIEEANPSLEKMLSTPKVYEAYQYYGFNYLNRAVIMTDQRGVFYSMDPVSLKATVLDAKPKEFPDINECKSTSAYISLSQEARMDGDLRKHVQLNDTTKSEESFLKGEILLEQDPIFLAEKARELQSESYVAISKVREQRDSMLKKYPLLSDETQAYRNYNYHDVVYNYRDLQNNLEEMKRDSSQGNYKLFQFLSGSALGSDSGFVFVAHANNLSDTSSLLLSKIKFDGKKLITQWTTLVPGIYFDPDKGIEKNPMKEVFKAGSPEFRFEEYGVKGNVLCGVKMLFAFGIDSRTGKLLWKQQL